MTQNNDKTNATRPHDPRSTGPAPADDDNVLESIGKAIAEPVRGAAEDEEPDADGKPRETPGP